MKKRFFPAVLFLVLIASAGFVYAAEGPQYSGFLGNYPTFKEGKKGVDKVWVKEGVDFRKYKRIMLDEVVFYFKKDSEYKGIHPDQIQEMANAYNQAFVEVFKDSYPLTDTPAEDVMRVRIAVTNLEQSSPTLGTVVTIIPVGLVVNLVKKGVTGHYIGIGSACMEAEFLDSLTNERIGAAIDEKPGGKFELGKLSPIKGTFEFWAKRLKVFLDNMHEARK